MFGTGKTVLLGEFVSRVERAGWVSLERELGDRHRDEEQFIDAVQADAEALVRRCDALAGVGQAVERGIRFLRPRRVSVGPVGLEALFEALSELDPRLHPSARESHTTIAGPIEADGGHQT